MHVIHANPLHLFLKVKQIKKFAIRLNMYQEVIDPPAIDWEKHERDYAIYLDWLEDHSKEWKEEFAEESLHAYECKVYNELDRRYV